MKTNKTLAGILMAALLTVALAPLHAAVENAKNDFNGRPGLIGHSWDSGGYNLPGEESSDVLRRLATTEDGILLTEGAVWKTTITSTGTSVNVASLVVSSDSTAGSPIHVGNLIIARCAPNGTTGAAITDGVYQLHNLATSASTSAASLMFEIVVTSNVTVAGDACVAGRSIEVNQSFPKGLAIVNLLSGTGAAKVIVNYRDTKANK